jgi:F-type H+-transporting ATPase subunit epsilon
MSFQCSLVTPEQKLFEGNITQAIVPAHDGLVGILTDRAPLLVKLGVGPLRLDLDGGQKEFFFVDGGVAQMKDNRLTVLTTEASPASEIDFEAAKAEMAEATAMKIPDEAAFARRQHQLDRARAKQEMGQK